ncbi:hypothetical protein FGIG_03492, partial [Fasciola gigantica]
YSLLVQEILAVYLQLDGFTAEEANRSVNQVVTLSQQPQAIPEQVSAWILTRYCNITVAATPASVNSPGSAFHVTADWDTVDQLASRASLPTIRLMAAFAGITATANYLNEQIRLNDQSDKAALLQSKLLGRWTRNLLLVPGRRLLRYGLVYKTDFARSDSSRGRDPRRMQPSAGLWATKLERQVDPQCPNAAAHEKALRGGINARWCCSHVILQYRVKIQAGHCSGIACVAETRVTT